MRYVCYNCFGPTQNGAAFDVRVKATAAIKINAKGAEITSNYKDWDFDVEIPEPMEFLDVTCGCCGEFAAVESKK